MKNNHGQVLVVFVILLPLLFLFCAYIVDVSYVSYHKNRLENINILVTDYVLNNSNIGADEIGRLVRQNDKEVMITKLNLEDNIEIELEKEVKSIFGRLIGKNTYIIKTNIYRNLVFDNEIQNAN